MMAKGPGATWSLVLAAVAITGAGVPIYARLTNGAEDGVALTMSTLLTVTCSALTIDRALRLGACAATLVMLIVAVVFSSGILAAFVCYVLYRSLDDIAAFVRFYCARPALLVAPLCAALALLLLRQRPVLLARSVATTKHTLVRTVTGLVVFGVCAVAIYVWDMIWPWPEEMLEQFLLVWLVFIGPGILFGIAALRTRGVVRTLCVLALLLVVGGPVLLR